MLFVGSEDLVKLRANIAALILEEQERLDLLVVQGIRALQPGDQLNEITSKYYQHQQWTMSLITTFRQNHPSIFLPQLSHLHKQANNLPVNDVFKHRRSIQPQPMSFKDKRISVEKINTGSGSFCNEENKLINESKSATLAGTECSSEAEPYTTCTSQGVMKTPDTPKQPSSAKKSDK